MRFKKYERHPFTDTSRKRAALARKQRLERETLPLLAEIIRSQQAPADQIMADRAAHWIAREQASRDRRAALWRRARRILQEMPDARRRAVLAFWNPHKWFPGDPVYLLDVLHMLERGVYRIEDGTMCESPAKPQTAIQRASMAALEDLENIKPPVLPFVRKRTT